MAKKAPKTKSEILAALAESAEISKKQAATVYENLLAIAYAGAKGPKGIVLPGLGKLIKVKRPARMGRNPATGAAIKIPAKTVAKFRLAKAAKDAVLSK
jgi:DNA-binding protein HU-beta